MCLIEALPSAENWESGEERMFGEGGGGGGEREREREIERERESSSSSNRISEGSPR